MWELCYQHLFLRFQRLWRSKFTIEQGSPDTSLSFVQMNVIQQTVSLLVVILVQKTSLRRHIFVHKELHMIVANRVPTPPLSHQHSNQFPAFHTSIYVRAAPGTFRRSRRGPRSGTAVTGTSTV
jgi:hypothetical protein